MGHAAAIPHHDRRGAPAPATPQGVDRAIDRSIALSPREWLDLFAIIGEGVRDAVVPLSGTEQGGARHAVGAGGDTTLEVDRVAEIVVLAELATIVERGEKFSVLSEEAGYRRFGADYPLVLVDPVDGSLNAKQGIPMFGVMLAVLDGPAVKDTVAGLVLNLSTGDAWTAIRQQGARRNGEPVTVLGAEQRQAIQMLALESTPRALTLASPLVERATKIRILGSMALSIAHTAAGAFDAFCAPVPVRMFDTAASLLLLAEAGGVATDIEGTPVAGLACGLETRSTLLCAPSPALHTHALELLAAGS